MKKYENLSEYVHELEYFQNGGRYIEIRWKFIYILFIITYLVNLHRLYFIVFEIYYHY